MTGTTCFKCGGNREILTKRGRAAYDYYMSLWSTKLAIDLVAGDRIRMSAGERATVVSTEASTSRYLNNATGEWTNYFDVKCRNITYSTFPDQTITLIPTRDECLDLLDRALKHQESLTKAGLPRKVRVQRKRAV